MQKDVIYIDTEDDITAIIGKVKAAKEKIVALVPPKRVGAIQSAVNLKLVHRTAEQAGKHLVIISNNQALMALASSAGIPTAKNLQSRPEMAEIPALDIDEGEDVIDGSSLSEVSAKEKPESGVAAATIAGAATAADATNKPPEGEANSSGAQRATENTITPSSKEKKRSSFTGGVPNFNVFRKKFIIILLAIIALIGFLVWALVFAPKAKIIITAQTSDVALNSPVSLDPAAQTSLQEGVIKTESKTVEKEISIPIVATGEKNVGEKAKGTVTFTLTSQVAFADGITIPAGTRVTSAGGSTYTTDAAVIFEGNDSIRNWNSGRGRTKATGVTATEPGAAYNGANGPASGAPSGTAAAFTTATSGGTDKTVKVVTQRDVDTALAELDKQLASEEQKKALTSGFDKDFIVIEQSFKTDASNVKPQPGVDQEAPDGRSALAGKVTYSLMAAPKSSVQKYLDQYFAQQIDGKSDQRVYSNGVDTVEFAGIGESNGKFSANLTASGKIGPKINEQAIKEYARGKKYGEIKEKIEQIDGVETVDVKFSPFWVTSAPNDIKKINFEFKVTDAK